MQTNVTQLFDKLVDEQRQNIAIYDKDKSISFFDLHALILKAAFKINNVLNGATGKIIGIYMPKSINSIIADIATLYSGNIYMNLDIKWPKNRINSVLAQTGAQLIISNNAIFEDVDTLNFDTLLNEDITENDKHIVLQLRNNIIDTDIACIINTSGSTGVPKSVALTHRGFIDYVQSVSTAKLVDNNEIVGSLAPIVFDHFSYELCLLLMKACSLVLIPESYAAFPIRMLELLKRHNVSFIFWVPTIMVNIANMNLLENIDLPSLKKIWFAGEVFPTIKFNYWKEHLQEALFVNLYGPTEITVDCTYYIANDVFPSNSPIPIGKALPNVDVFLMDDENNMISKNCQNKTGEIFVRGSGLAKGYYNNFDKTAEAFVQNPLVRCYPDIVYKTGDIAYWDQNGDLIFKGRKDTLIKHSGYRIELGEIEHVIINNLDYIHNACVIYDNEAKKIILVYEATGKIDSSSLHKDIASLLPRYMVPFEYIFITEMPQNKNGKIDRLKIQNDYLNKNLQ